MQQVGIALSNLCDPILSFHSWTSVHIWKLEQLKPINTHDDSVLPIGFKMISHTPYSHISLTRICFKI